LAIEGRLIGSEKATCRAQTCGNTEKQKNRKTEKQKNRKTEQQKNRTTEQQIFTGISNRSASGPT
jgi:hypothetical protein